MSDAAMHPKNPSDTKEPWLFKSRFLLLPFIASMILATVLLVIFSVPSDLYTLALACWRQQAVLLPIVKLLEDLMIATLLIYSALGHYHIYVKPVNLHMLRDTTPTKLKVFTNYSIASVTSVVLLQDLTDSASWDILLKHLVVHFTFIFSGLLIGRQVPKKDY